MVKLNNKMRWTVSAIFAVLILFGTYHNIFSIIAFLGVCLLLFFCERETILLQLFFIMPMANIFKMSPSSQSFFTIILLLYVVMYFVLPRKATLLIVLFSIYIILGQLVSGSFMLFRTVKLICNILFLSSILNQNVTINHKSVFFSYIIGNITASCFGLMDSNFFKIKDYVGEQGVEGIEFIDLTRFTGLHTDPNYYTVGMIISLCLLVVLYHRKEVKTSLALLISVPIVYFLILTYSKSAILMLAVPLFFVFYSLYKQKKFISILVVFGLAVFVLLMALSGKIEILNVVISRFNASSDSVDDTDLNSLTTGRFGIWVSYVKYMFNHYLAFFVGEGISAPYLEGHATHNLYIEMWYHLGIIGSSMLLWVLWTILKQCKLVVFNRKLINYSVLISSLLLYCFLSELFYYDPPFHIMLAFVMLNLPSISDNMPKEIFKTKKEGKYVVLQKDLSCN